MGAGKVYNNFGEFGETGHRQAIQTGPRVIAPIPP
jgi:hypothetical protein